MRRLATSLAALGLSLVPYWCDAAPGSLDVHWLEGAEDCASDDQPPLQVHAYEAQTYILRQSPCADFEANFLYLLIGSERALLIDTGAVEDAAAMPLAATVLDLLPAKGDAKLPLLITHTHGHLDHRAGDALFAGLPAVEIVPTDVDGLRAYFGFKDWPEGDARIDLGGRVIDVVPIPGHHPAHLLFYDSRTQLLFSGDFLLPGRLLIDDLAAYRQSADRAVEFVKTRPVSHVLGGHIELDADGEPYVSGAEHHPNERRLELDEAALLALPAALQDFNGFYSRHPDYILTNPMHNLAAFGAFLVVALGVIVWGVRRFLRHRRTQA